MGSKWNGHGSSFLGQLPPGSNNWVWLKEQDHRFFPFFCSNTVFTRIRATALIKFFKNAALILRVAFIWKLDATKNYCFNYDITIFRIKQTELTSFDSEYIRALVLIQGQCLSTFLSQMWCLFQGGAYSEVVQYSGKYGKHFKLIILEVSLRI